MAFYRQYPFDDFHRRHRPAALIAQAMAGGKIEDKLDWLQPQNRESNEIENIMRALGVRRD